MSAHIRILLIGGLIPLYVAQPVSAQRGGETLPQDHPALAETAEAYETAKSPRPYAAFPESAPAASARNTLDQQNGPRGRNLPPIASTANPGPNDSAAFGQNPNIQFGQNQNNPFGQNLNDPRLATVRTMRPVTRTRTIVETTYEEIPQEDLKRLEAFQKAVREMRKPHDTTEDREAARSALEELVLEQMDRDLETREQQLAEIEAQAKALRDQLEQRKNSRQEFAKLIMLMIENPAAGIGLPSEWMGAIGPASGAYAPLPGSLAPNRFLPGNTTYGNNDGPRAGFPSTPGVAEALGE
ncbi:MAG: hypothetical protein R3C53_04575 [Pirellulaceae bacterium]